MTDRKIQQIWQNSYEAFLSSGYFLSDAQKKASYAILNYKTGSFGMNISPGYFMMDAPLARAERKAI